MDTSTIQSASVVGGTAWWEWLVYALGILGFGMSIQPFTQSVFGQSNLKISFGLDDTGGLRVNFYNQSVKCWLLRLLHVNTNDVKAISASFGIFDQNGKEIFRPKFVPKIQNHAGTFAIQVDLRAGAIPAWFPALFRHEQQVTALNHDDSKENLQPLARGEYVLRVRGLADGKTIELSTSFVVTDQYPYLVLKNKEA